MSPKVVSPLFDTVQVISTFVANILVILQTSWKKQLNSGMLGIWD